GDGPLRPNLEDEARGLPVRFLGYCEMRPVWAACDLVVLPSLTEGLPLVALEAAAHGRPVLASAVGELPEVLGGGAGLLVPPGDPAALGAGLSRLLADAGLRARLAERAGARVAQRYGAERMAQEYAEQLYAPALG